MKLNCDIKQTEEGYKAEVKTLDGELIEVIQKDTIIEVLEAFEELTNQEE